MVSSGHVCDSLPIGRQVNTGVSNVIIRLSLTRALNENMIHLTYKNTSFGWSSF